MSAHEQVRLETTGGTVIAYFAPMFEANATHSNSVINEGIPGDGSALVIDFGQWVDEVTVQGTFMHSDELPQAHQSALETLFGSLPVTAQQQVDRLVSFGRYGEPGPLHFYNQGRSYETGNEGTQAEIQAGDYPPVVLEEIRPAEEGGRLRDDILIRMAVGAE